MIETYLLCIGFKIHSILSFEVEAGKFTNSQTAVIPLLHSQFLPVALFHIFPHSSLPNAACVSPTNGLRFSLVHLCSYRLIRWVSSKMLRERQHKWWPFLIQLHWDEVLDKANCLLDSLPRVPGSVKSTGLTVMRKCWQNTEWGLAVKYSPW